MTETIIVTGAGGVGKTTLSAALACSLAASGRKTLVMTIDPAKRLADALGIGELGDEPKPVEGRPGMWAAMLDVSASWEAIIHRHAEPEVGDRLLVNPYFRAIADRFPAAQYRMIGSLRPGSFDSAWDSRWPRGMNTEPGIIPCSNSSSSRMSTNVARSSCASAASGVISRMRRFAWPSRSR